MQREPITQARRQLINYLEQAREERGFNFVKLAEESGIDPATIESILTGKSDFTADQLLSLCLALNLDISLNSSTPRDEMIHVPEVMLCEDPVNDSDFYLLHTRSPHSLWLCELIDDDDAEEEEENDEAISDEMLHFRTWDGYEEGWRIQTVALYEATTEEELQIAADRCSKYLRAYLSWEDEEMRQSNLDSLQ